MNWHDIWTFIWTHIQSAGIWFWLFLASEALSEIKSIKDNSLFQVMRRAFRLVFFFKSGKKPEDIE